MGAQSTRGILEAANSGLVSLPSEAILHWHLQSNHYPPLPVSLVPACQRAIELVAGDQGQTRVRLPKGLVGRDGRRSVVAEDLVEAVHLWDFVEAAVEDQTSSDSLPDPVG
jgi:hypothetical protein